MFFIQSINQISVIYLRSWIMEEETNYYSQENIKKKKTKKFGSNKIITYLCSRKSIKVCQQYLLCSDIGSGFMEMTIRPFIFM